MSYFKDHAAQLAANRWPVVPLGAGIKYPTIKEWQEFRYSKGVEKKFPKEGIGLLTQRMPAVDIDVRKKPLADELQKLAEKMLGPAPVRVGKAPKRALIYRTELAPFKKLEFSFRLKTDAPDDKPHKIEILADGQQVVAYGIHPDTKKEYQWVTKGREPLTMKYEELTPITLEMAQAYLAAAEEIIKADPDVEWSADAPTEDGELSEETFNLANPQQVASLQSALDFLATKGKAEDETIWSKFGWIMGRAFGRSPEGLVMFDGFAAKASNYNPAKTKTHYHGNKSPADGVMATTRTIFKLARKLGWRPAEVQLSDLVTVCAADVVTKEVAWLWPGLIARGKVTLIAGDPGLGKSLITLSLASVVSNGGRWPATREQCDEGEVLLISGEDDVADTIVPRLRAAGANLSKIRIIELVRVINPQTAKVSPRGFSLQTDMELLEHELAKHEGRISLVVIDPMGAFTGSTDSHKNSEVRFLLMPLSNLAAKFNAAIVAAHHLNKSSGGSAMYRITGSLGFVAMARAAFVVVKDKDVPARRLMMPVKNNLAVDTFGLAYSMRANEKKIAYVSWEDKVVTGEEVDALLAAPAKSDAPKMKEAVRWLGDQFIDTNSVAVAEIERRAEVKGLNMATVKKAKAELGIESRKGGVKDPWTWEMPR